MKKRLVAAFLAGAMALSMAGCGGDKTPSSSSTPSGTNSEVTEIVFWHAMGGTIGEQIDLMVKNYNESQDKVHVTVQFQGKYDEELTKLKSSMTGGSGAPDIVQVYDIGTKFMVDSGFVIPVEDMMADGSFDKASIEPNLVSYYSVDGKQYAMPFNTSIPLVYYNKDAFKEAGLDPEVAPATFEEIKEYAAKLVKKDGDKVIRPGFAAATYGWWSFEQPLAGMGVLYANNDNGRTANATEVAFNENDAALTVIKTFQDLNAAEGVANYGRQTTDTRNAFIAGKVAMIFDASSQLSLIEEGIGGRFEMGVGYFPKIGENPEGGIVPGGGALWLIDNKDEAKKAAAWDFMCYASSPEAQAVWSANTGYLATVPAAYDLPAMVEVMENNPNFKIAVDELRNSPTNNYTAGGLLGVFPEARTIFEENMEQVLLGKMTAEECVSAITEKINASIANYNETTETAK